MTKTFRQEDETFALNVHNPDKKTEKKKKFSIIVGKSKLFFLGFFPKKSL